MTKHLNLLGLSIVFLCIYLIAGPKAQAQCFSDITLSSQADVDSYNSVYGCSTLIRSLTIDGGTITNLDSLYRIDTIFRDLEIIDNFNLTNLDGLGNLKAVFRDVDIDNNDKLLSLDGLSNLLYVGRDMRIDDNRRIKSLSGLENLTEVGSDLDIVSNDSLASLSEMDSIFFVGDKLEIRFNGQLSICNEYWICKHIFCGRDTDVNFNGPGCMISSSGIASCGCTLGGTFPIDLYIVRQEDVDSFPKILDQCPFEVGDLTIQGSAITSLDSLYTLEDVSGSFVIQAAGSLTSLSGLEHLAFAENLQIRNNALITDIGAIDSNIQVESFLEIWNNSELENCDEVWVCRALECVGFYRIENNKGDCALEYNVVTSCPCVAGTEVIDLTFTSQGQIDSFPLLFQQCPVQVRNIDIADVNDITNLDSLYPITEIGEDLVLEELPRLKDLSGLRNVIGVGGSITIELCDSLTSLDGLQNIDQLYDLNIIENALLTSIAEMDSFINVISDLSIYANPLLETCNVFWLCRNLGFEFNSVDVSDNGTGCIEKSDFISGCYCVVNPLRAEVELNTQAQVDSFPVLYQSCGVKPLSLLIIGNGILNLDSLYQIDSLLNLDIFGCDSLVDLSGLSNLQYVENEIEFTNNDILEDISALHPDLKVNSIRLINNDSLNTCDVAWVCKAIERGAQYFINNNASDCADEETVAYACVCSGLADTLDVSLSTQSEVDMFASFYDQCDFKIRSLDVDAASNQYISNLDSLIAIDSIYGTLNLETLAPPDSLLDLSGLQNLVYVKGDFRLEQINISDLSDFENIQYVGGDIIILENDQLEDMAGLDATLRIDGDV